MTFYQQQIAKIKKEFFSKEYLFNQVVYAKLYIDCNYANKLELEDIAGKAFFSKFHFLKLFKKTYGITPCQYLKSVRITEAKKLLQSGRPVADVAFSIGFDSATSFAGLFKKATGHSPSAYQKKWQANAVPAQVPLKYWLPYQK